MAITFKMESTGNYDEVKIAKFHKRQMSLNNNNSEIADAMVRMYKHTFLIREKVKF